MLDETRKLIAGKLSEWPIDGPWREWRIFDGIYVRYNKHTGEVSIIILTDHWREYPEVEGLKRIKMKAFL